MEIPEVIVEFGLGVVSLVGGGGFVFLKNKSSKNADDIADLKDKIVTECDEMDQKILDAIEHLGEKVTPIQHCNAKQELWQERFDMWMSQNTQQHDHIGDSVGAALGGIEKQLEVVFDKMDSVQECLNKIQANKEC